MEYHLASDQNSQIAWNDLIKKEFRGVLSWPVFNQYFGGLWMYLFQKGYYSAPLNVSTRKNKKGVWRTLIWRRTVYLGKNCFRKATDSFLCSLVGGTWVREGVANLVSWFLWSTLYFNITLNHNDSTFDCNLAKLQEPRQHSRRKRSHICAACRLLLTCLPLSGMWRYVVEVSLRSWPDMCVRN